MEVFSSTYGGRTVKLDLYVRWNIPAALWFITGYLMLTSLALAAVNVTWCTFSLFFAISCWPPLRSITLGGCGRGYWLVGGDMRTSLEGTGSPMGVCTGWNGASRPQFKLTSAKHVMLQEFSRRDNSFLLSSVLGGGLLTLFVFPINRVVLKLKPSVTKQKIHVGGN